MVKRVLSGIRASGRLHLGNYLGAVKGMLELQDNPNYKTYYMVADLHAITTPYLPESLKRNRMEVVLDYLAAGLDPEKSVIFIQSDIPAHTELAFYFSTLVSVARMQHLPTFKEKVKNQPQSASMALLGYPVLMAADILAYKANAVPVGDDQLPHLEVAREIARKINAKYGLDFPEPVQFKTPGHYVPSLTGEGKMSKSVKGSYINLTDDLDTIRERLAKVPTDQGKGRVFPQKGGVASLLTLVELFQGSEKAKEYKNQYIKSGIKYSQLKSSLAEAIYSELAPIQKRRSELGKNLDYVQKILEKGAEKARDVANQTLLKVRKAMGFMI